jgi:uncharacterized protein (TIGR02118 family)
MTSTADEAGQDKPTKISFVYSNPTDPAAFEAAYPEQLALARKLPGLTRLQTSKVWPKEDGSPTPAYRLLDLYFADYAAASAAAAEAGALVGARARHRRRSYRIRGGPRRRLDRHETNSSPAVTAATN